MLIDTHAHVNFAAYKDDGDEVVKRALENNIWMINVGSQWDTSRRAISYAKKYPQGVFAAVALHPIHLKENKIKFAVDPQEVVEFETQAEKFDYEKYKELASQPKVVAIGETGLDYYRIESPSPEEQARLKDLQKAVFKKHIELARELGKPLIIHCREAHEEILEILGGFCEPGKNREAKDRKFDDSATDLPFFGAGDDSNNKDKLVGIIHSFSGRWSQAQRYLAMGFYLSFNGIITFARDYDKVIKNMPLERLVLETDCPYLTPVPHRGKRNEPSFVKYVAEKVAEIRGISFDEVASVTTDNAKKLFKI